MTSYGQLARKFMHVVWADELCVAAAESVPGARFGETFGFSFGSVHATLVHMLGAQHVWLARLNGDRDPVFPDPAGLPTLDTVRHRWADLHDEWKAFLLRQTETSLDDLFQYTRRDQIFRSPLRVIVAHVFDHATHHRGQLNSLVRLAGGTPFDYGEMAWSRLTGETIEAK